MAAIVTRNLFFDCTHNAIKKPGEKKKNKETSTNYYDDYGTTVQNNNYKAGRSKIAYAIEITPIYITIKKRE